MKFTPEVVAALAVLRNAAENDFERHRLDVLERDLHEPPKVEIIDDRHQKFNSTVYSKRKDNHYSKPALSIHRAVWQYFYGDIPDDYVIHHVDGNPANNNIKNLQSMQRCKHTLLHSATICHTKKGTFVCVVCGKIYEANDTGQNRYCSLKCHWKANSDRQKKNVNTCEYCGCEYTTRFKNQKYCSANCYRQARRIKKICPVCKKEFPSKRKETVCCSPSCGAKLRWQKRQS